MNIDDVSANIDAKRQRLEQQLANLRSAREQVAEDASAVAVIDRDIQALLDTRDKLDRSRELVWQVHDIGQQTRQNDRKDRHYQRLGLALVGLGAVLLLGLGGLYLYWL